MEDFDANALRKITQERNQILKDGGLGAHEEKECEKFIAFIAREAMAEAGEGKQQVTRQLGHGSFFRSRENMDKIFARICDHFQDRGFKAEMGWYSGDLRITLNWE